MRAPIFTALVAQPSAPGDWLASRGRRRIELRHELEKMTGKQLADLRDTGSATPSAPFEMEACRSDIQIEKFGAGAIGGNRGYSIFCLAPSNMTEKPGTGRLLGEFHFGGFGHILETDEAMLEREWDAIGKVQAVKRDDLAVLSEPFLRITFGLSDLA